MKLEITKKKYFDCQDVILCKGSLNSDDQQFSFDIFKLFFRQYQQKKEQSPLT